MSSDFPHPNKANGNTGPEGTLRVEVPHWAAHVRVYNNLHQPVFESANLQRLSQSPPVYVAELTLSPGIYEVETKLEDRLERKVVTVHESRVKTIRCDEWKSLKLTSAAPLSDTVTSKDIHTSSAQEWSRKVTWKTSPGGDSRLFIFLRTLKPERNKSFADGLYLLSATGDRITDFSESAVKDHESGWMAFNAPLSPGCYVLQRRRSDAEQVHVPICLSPGWETQVFIRSKRIPSMRSLTINLAREGRGFLPNDEATIATETVLDALRSGDTRQQLVTSETMTTLLSGKFENPWLGVLAAHVLLRSGALDPLTGETVDSEPDLTRLFNEVLGNLSNFDGLQDHPDIRALRLKSSEPAPQPFREPPQLQASLLRVKRHGLKFAGTIPFQSLMDCVLDTAMGDSVWTAWRYFVSPPAEWHDSSAIRPVDLSQRHARAQIHPSVFVERTTAKAPVIRLPQVSDESSAQPESGSLSDSTGASNALRDLSLVQKAIEVTDGLGSADLPGEIRLNVSQSFDELLSQLVPEELSDVLDVPLSRVQHGLESLRQTSASAGKTGEEIQSDAQLTPTEVAVLEYAVSKAATARQKAASDTIAADDRLESAFESVPADATPTETSAPPSIEECVNKLFSEATSLTIKAGKKEASPECAEQALNLAGRLQELGNAVLKYAEFVVVTDGRGQILYANTAFTILLSRPLDVLGKGTRGVIDRPNIMKTVKESQKVWMTALDQAPLGRSNLSSPVSDKTLQSWELRRTFIKDEATDEQHASLNILRASDAPTNSLSVRHDVAKLLPALSLYSSSFACDRREQSIDYSQRLEELVSQLEQIVRKSNAGISSALS